MDELWADLEKTVSAATLLGYLNFSDGRPDVRWQKQLHDAYAFLVGRNVPRPWEALRDWLTRSLDRLHAGDTAAFRDVTQAANALALFGDILPAYRHHHADLLAHQGEQDLYQPFFLVRVFEAILAHRAASGSDPDPDRAVLDRLNDFLGYRPLAVLETRPHGEPYPHERFRPVPLFLRGVGVAVGRYHDVLTRTLELLAATDPDILQAAHLDLDLLDEFALDVRAYDLGHPVNRRPNYVFGEWDPHHMDNQSRYRRYVARQVTLDALLSRVEQPGERDRGELFFEAATVLAGTVLMATGISGSGPSAHDSSQTLAVLMPGIARYRDQFYQQLLQRLTGPHGERLRQEQTLARQPFGSARQHLNAYLARHRAAQLQQRYLALLFAEMGYPEASRAEARRVPQTGAPEAGARGEGRGAREDRKTDGDSSSLAPHSSPSPLAPSVGMAASAAVRFLSEILSRLSTGHRETEHGRLAAAARVLPEVEDLIHRGIACGALADPWNILGFQALFPLSPAQEDSLRDSRLDELVQVLEQTFHLYARLSSEAAAAGEGALAEQLLGDMRRLAAWWDQFATTEVSDIRHVSGEEAASSAEHVATALGRWHQRGEATADLAFWRQHLDSFHSPKAFALVVDALLRKEDYRAALALLINWVGQAEQVLLEEGPHSFHNLALRWLLGVTGAVSTEKRDLALAKKFFDYLEVNAEDYWQVPALETAETLPMPRESGAEDDLFGAAYEDVTYRDSTGDDDEGAVVGSRPREEFDLEQEGETLERRLRFLSTVARLWVVVARAAHTADGGEGGPGFDRATLSAWEQTAGTNLEQLLTLMDVLHAHPIPEAQGNYEALVEYDRRRVLKEQLVYAAVGTCLDMTMAVGALHGAGAAGAGGPSGGTLAEWGPDAIRLERALFRGDVAAVRSSLANFLERFRQEPLLFTPLDLGGDPRQVLRVRVAQAVLRVLLLNLPRLGLVRETFELLKTARAMEHDHPPQGRGVTEFNQYFQAGFVETIEAVVAAAVEWGADFEDAKLARLLERLTAPFLALWIEHSRAVQISSVEGLGDEAEWERLRAFVRRYGSDLFHARFMTLANLRGVLHRGVGAYLDYLGQDADPLRPVRLIADLDRTVPRAEAVRRLEFILRVVVENYEEYKDYNATTSQSDYGENLHVLLDFLQLKGDYERHAWEFRPLVLAHEVLARRGRRAAAVLWERSLTHLTGGLARSYLDRLAALERSRGVRLNTVGDRLNERFVKPLALDRLRALIEPASRESQVGGPTPAFARLQEELRAYTATPTGVGLDVPAWLRSLETEVHRVQAARSTLAVLAEGFYRAPRRPLSLDELKRQLDEWDKK